MNWRSWQASCSSHSPQLGKHEPGRFCKCRRESFGETAGSLRSQSGDGRSESVISSAKWETCRTAPACLNRGAFKVICLIGRLEIQLLTTKGKINSSTGNSALFGIAPDCLLGFNSSFVNKGWLQSGSREQSGYHIDVRLATRKQGRVPRNTEAKPRPASKPGRG